MTRKRALQKLLQEVRTYRDAMVKGQVSAWQRCVLHEWQRRGTQSNTGSCLS